MRVLFVTALWPSDARPWHGSFVKSQADSLEREGVEVEVLVVDSFRRRSAYAQAAATCARLALRPSHDLVHAHYGHAAVAARAYATRPLVVSYCGDDLLGTRTPSGCLTRRSRAEAAVFRRLAYVSARTITKTAEMEAALPPATRPRNHVIPNGVDLARFAPLPRDVARERLGWPQEGRVILFLANPEVATKNYPLAVDTAARVAERLPDATLRVGWGYPHEEVPLLTSASDVLLFTSQAEGSPNAVKEAMAAELPIVATPVGDIEERLSGVEGCFVCPPDATALAAAVVRALERGRSPSARAAVEQLALDAVARRVREVYEQALDQRLTGATSALMVERSQYRSGRVRRQGGLPLGARRRATDD